MKSVYQYSSFGDFIKAAFKNSGQGAARWSIEKFAQRLGIGCSILKMVMSGKRKPTVHHALKFAHAFKLSQQETLYLQDLVLKESAKGDWEKAFYRKNLKHKKQNSQIETLSTSHKLLLSDTRILPFAVYMMELLSRSKTSQDVDLEPIAKRFGYTHQEVRNIFDKLISDDLLKGTTDGKFHLAFDQLSHPALQKDYLQNVLREALGRIEKDYNGTKSVFSAYTFTVSNKNLLKLRMDLKALMETYMADPQLEGELNIAQACFQIFPVVEFNSSDWQDTQDHKNKNIGLKIN